LISPPLRLQHSPEKEETNTKLLPTCLPFGIMARRNFRSRRQTPELAKAAFRPERSTTKQSVVENMHQLEQLQSLQIQSRKPVSDTIVDLKRQGTKTTTTLLPQPPWAKKPWETTTILTQINCHTSLFRELLPDPTPTTTVHHGQPAGGQDGGRRTRLAGVDDELRNGITPYSTWEKLNLDLQLIYTSRRAPFPSPLRPATPSKEQRDRAGIWRCSATLNGGTLVAEKERAPKSKCSNIWWRLLFGLMCLRIVIWKTRLDMLLYAGKYQDKPRCVCIHLL
jgi:hypothetical protein